MAYERYVMVWQKLIEHIQEVPKSAKETTREHKGEIIGMIGVAKKLGQEACEEPRWWRTEFPSELFHSACKNLFHIRVLLTNLENIAAHGRKAGSEKTETFKEMCQMSSFSKIWEDLGH